MNNYGLKLLEILSNSRPNEWNSLFESTLNIENAQIILSFALCNMKDASLVAFTLQLLRGSNCHLDTIAKTICAMETPNDTIMVKNYKNRVFVSQKVNRHIQERIEKCIDKILGARSSDEVRKRYGDCSTEH